MPSSARSAIARSTGRRFLAVFAEYALLEELTNEILEAFFLSGWPRSPQTKLSAEFHRQASSVVSVAKALITGKRCSTPEMCDREKAVMEFIRPSS